MLGCVGSYRFGSWLVGSLFVGRWPTVNLSSTILAYLIGQRRGGRGNKVLIQNLMFVKVDIMYIFYILYTHIFVYIL
jgi:hypothetical protein